MNIQKELNQVASTLKCQEVKEDQVVKTFCYLISKYNMLETDEAYSIILFHLPAAIQSWKEGIAHNLSSAIYTRGRFYLLNAVKEARRLKRKEEGTFSLDAQNSEENNLHEMIEGKSETVDWKDAFDFLFGNAGFSEREKQVFLGLKDGKTLKQLGNEFGVSRQAIHLSKNAIEDKSNRIRHKVLGSRVG